MSVESDDDHSTTEHDEESLPFALIPEIPRTPLHQLGLNKSAVPSPHNSLDCNEGSSHLSGYSGPPALASSVISAPTDGESQASSAEYPNGASSLLASHMGSHYLDTAASLLQPNSSLMSGSSQLQPLWQTEPTWTATATEPPRPAALVSPDQSIGFSQLMQEADNKHELVTTTTTTTTTAARNGSISRLPVLPEEQSVLSSDSLILSSYHFPDASGPASPLPFQQTAADTQRRTTPWFPTNLFQPQRTVPQSSIMMSPLSSSSSAAGTGRSGSGLTDERRLASLAGATATMTGVNAFSVQVDISAPGTDIRDVMDLLGNPDLLKLWCDPIQALVITKSSEGAQNAANRGSFQQQQHETDREYEGEWIEATTPALVAPRAGYVQRAGDAVSFYLGFPTYGKVTMFVERQRGRVGLTVGPFAGGIVVSHNLKILSEDNGKIRIVDDVKLRRPDDASDEQHFCGVLDILGKCYLPTLDDFMDQVLSSMARLRFLVERGEHSVYVEACGDGSACTPLLCAV
jgi:hypothetical protein